MSIKNQIDRVVAAQGLSRAAAAEQVAGRLYEARQYIKARRHKVQADSKSEAIRKARKQAEYDGHVPARGMGKATFTAISAN